MTDIVETYARPSLPGTGRFDEMVDAAGGVRATWAGVGAALGRLGPDGLAEQRRSIATTLTQQGVTYRPPGATRERPWTLDPVPLLVAADEWAGLAGAVQQRTRLLDLVLTDLYGPRRLLADGLVPPELVLGHPGFVRAADGVRLPGRRQLFLGATDVVRGPDGAWVALTDHAQAPSGAGYAMVDRQAVSRALPGLFRDTGVQRLAPFFQTVRQSLQALAPGDAEAPRVVLLTAGPGSETAFDQANLSRLLGFPLVQGADLVVRDGRVWQRSIGRLERVDVVLRRVDAEFCDPLELRADSQLGVPGLLEACRLGSVAVVNGLGTGVLENPALFPFLPRLAEVLLDEALLLPSARTWWCGDPAARRHVLQRLPELVVKPVSRGVRSAHLVGRELSADALDLLARRIEAEPYGWVGQELVEASTSPVAGGAGLRPRPAALRTFAVAHGDGYRVLPGGLGRAGGVSREEAGGAARDVWVLTGAPGAAGEPVTLAGPGRVGSAISPRVAETLFWLGRYAERAEDVSRLVGVTDSVWRDVHGRADPALRAAADVLLDATIAVTATVPAVVPAGEPVHTHLFTVLGDTGRAGTVIHDVRRLLELAGASRDQLSVDTWTVLDGLEEVLAPFDPAPGGTGSWVDRDVQAAMSRLRASLMAFAGLTHESMVRDVGWHFLDAGRRLERALQLARLLRALLGTLHGPGVDVVVQEQLLVAAESGITHRRRYPGRPDAAGVLDLLLLDVDNPRALAFQLDRLAVDLRRVAPGEDLAARVTPVSAALAACAAGALAEADASGVRVALTALLDDVVGHLHALADEVDDRHFDHHGRLRQLGVQVVA